MHRFWIEEAPQDGLTRLSAEDAQHALRVLRMRPGDACEALWNEGRFAAEVAEASGGEVLLRLLSPLPSTEAKTRITLFQGLPKADKMELIVQKAVELGAETVVPVSMRRCVVKLDERDARKKQERWQKIAREAGKQSGRCRPMAVEAPISLPALCRRLPAFDLALVPWEEEHALSLSSLHSQHPGARQIAVVIGPEGGMAEDEIEAMRRAGCKSATLGPRILRTETAGLCALSALFCLYGDMEGQA